MRCFRYAHIIGFIRLVFSNSSARCLDMTPEVYASIVSIRDIGLRSVSDPGFGMGIRLVCFARWGSILCISDMSMMSSMMSIHCGGSLASRLSVNPSCLALLGIVAIDSARSVCMLGLFVSVLIVNGHVRAGWGAGSVKIWAN